MLKLLWFIFINNNFMYTLNNIKKLFKKNIIQNFAPDTLSTPIEEKPEDTNFNWDALQDLKKLKEYLKNWLTSSEAEIINKHMDEIQEEAKLWLKEIAGEMLRNGFTAKNEKAYNSFKNLIKNSTGVIVPEWNNIIQRLEDNVTMYNQNNLKWLTIKHHTIQVEYDWIMPFDNNDTLNLHYFKDTWKLSTRINKWSETKDNNTSETDSTINIDTSILDDNINNIIETKENKKEIKLLENAIKIINDFNIEWKSEKDFDKYLNEKYSELLRIIWEEDINKILEKHPDYKEKIDNLIKVIKNKLKEQNKEKSEFSKEKIDKAITWYKWKPKKSIKNLQSLLNIKNIDDKAKSNTITIDWIIWKETITEIMKFQKRHKLTVDWIAGKNTLKALGAENPNTFYNKNEKKSTSSEKKEKKWKKQQEINEVEVQYGVDKDERIKAAKDFLNNNESIVNFLINTDASIWTYKIPLENWKSYDIVLKKWITWKLEVELDWEWFIDDLDQNVEWTTLNDIKKAITLLIQKKEAEIKETDSYKEKQIIKNIGLSREELNIIASDLDAEYNNLKEKDWNQVLEIDRWGTNDINIWIKDWKIFINDDSWLININNLSKLELRQTIIDSWTYLWVIEELDDKIRNQKDLTPEEQKLKDYLKRHNKINSKVELKKIMWDLDNNLQWVKEEAKEIEEKNNKFREILNKLEKDWIIWETTIKIDSGDYKWKKFDLNFEIDWDKLILDSAWNQPGTDKEIQINIDKIVWKTNDQIMEYINSLKNKLIAEYKNQVAKQKKQKYDPTKTDNKF